MPTPPPRQREERRVTLVALVINLALGAAKTGIGLLAHSTALIADGLHSISDLASDLAVLWGIRAARAPADSDHHYGHARYESIVTMFVGLLLITASLYVAFHSILSINEVHAGPANWLPFWIAIASIALKEALFWATRSVGRRNRNKAVLANAWHHRSDSFSSIAAAVGIAGTLVGGPRWAFLDHLTGVVLAAFLVVVGARIVRDALRDLSDRAPDPELQARMKDTMSRIPGVEGFHALRARNSGGAIDMDVHVQVEPGLTVLEGHDIATRVEREMCAAFPEIADIVVHIEPDERNDGGFDQP
jgi:cation diffusion facilitator family transporter